MIKLCVLCPRKPDLTLEEFEHHWKNVHGPSLCYRKFQTCGYLAGSL
jgi:hypothetical protein